MSKPVFRLDEIIRLCQGKSVLHMGYVQHSHLYDRLIKEGNWVHSNIANVASEVVGLDYLRDDVKIIKDKYGFEGYYADAAHLEELQLNRQFDVIICGELIEHITNAGLMLDGIKRFMHKDSILVITTPNAWGSEYTKKVDRGMKEADWINPEHISWYSYYTLQNTLDRHGYEEVNYGYYNFFETEKQYYNVEPGVVGKLKVIKRKMAATAGKSNKQLGLFFVARKKQ